MIVDNREGCICAKGNLSNYHLIKHDCKGINIGTVIEIFFTFGLLRRNVLGRAHDHIPGQGRFTHLGNARQAKIREVDTVVGADDDVGGFNIPMQNPLLMSVS